MPGTVVRAPCRCQSRISLKSPVELATPPPRYFFIPCATPLVLYDAPPEAWSSDRGPGPFSPPVPALRVTVSESILPLRRDSPRGHPASERVRAAKWRRDRRAPAGQDPADAPGAGSVPV